MPARRMQRSKPGLVVEGASPGAEQRHLDVLDHGVLGQQVVRLEDEAEKPAADLGKLIVVHDGDVFVAEIVLAARGPIEATEHVEQRRFARAGRAHEGDEIPFLDGETDAAQGVDRHRFEVVVLDQVPRCGPRRPWVMSFLLPPWSEMQSSGGVSDGPQPNANPVALTLRALISCLHLIHCQGPHD